MTDTTYKAVGPYADAANLLFGVLVFILPWTYGLDAGAAWSAWVSGALVAALAAAALVRFAEWEEWINVLLGAWIAVSPWVFGFTGAAGALWSHLVLGLLIAGVAAWRGWSAHQGASKATA
jgi:hypothetical protein